MLPHAHRQLQPDALIAREERQEAMGGGGTDDLDAAARLEPAERGDQVPVEGMKELAQPVVSLEPEGRERNQVRVAGSAQRLGRRVARLDPLVEERLDLGAEERVRQLVGQHRRNADRHRRLDAVALERLERLDERQVGVQRRLGEPVGAVRPAAVIEHPRQVAVQGQHEVEAHEWASTARYTAA